MYRHTREVRAMNCDRCGQVMREGTHYWGKYCQGESCFNSELARLIYGARYKREGASK
jgi:transposase